MHPILSGPATSYGERLYVEEESLPHRIVYERAQLENLERQERSVSHRLHALTERYRRVMALLKACNDLGDEESEEQLQVEVVDMEMGVRSLAGHRFQLQRSIAQRARAVLFLEGMLALCRSDTIRS